MVQGRDGAIFSTEVEARVGSQLIFLFGRCAGSWWDVLLLLLLFVLGFRGETARGGVIDILRRDSVQEEEESQAGDGRHDEKVANVGVEEVSH